jgi:hypothetical protein
MGARFLVGVEGLELDLFRLRLCLASWLRDVDDPDTRLWDDVDEALSEDVVLQTIGLGDAEG